MNRKATYNSQFTILSFILFFIIQGIFVGAQTNEGYKYLKSNNYPLIRLKAYNVNTPIWADETVIYFDSLATEGFDPALDAYKLMNSSPGLPNIYSVINHNLRLCINSLPIDWDTLIVVPLGLEVDATAEYSIEASAIQNIPSDNQIYLVDSSNGVIQNLLNKSSYTFTCTTGFSESRFYLKFVRERKIVTVVPKLPTSNPQLPNIFANANELSISNINSPKYAVISVYNTIGQIVSDTKVNANNNQKIALQRGIYIVKISSQDKAYSKKIIIE